MELFENVQSASSLDKMVKDGNIDNMKAIFETSHSWFDAVIHLNEFKCSRIKELNKPACWDDRARARVALWDMRMHDPMIVSLFGTEAKVPAASIGEFEHALWEPHQVY